MVLELEQTERAGQLRLSPGPASYYLHEVDHSGYFLISDSSSSNGALGSVWPPSWRYGEDHPRGLWAKGIIYGAMAFDSHCIFPLLCQECSRKDGIEKVPADPSFPGFVVQPQGTGRMSGVEGWTS